MHVGVSGWREGGRKEGREGGREGCELVGDRDVRTEGPPRSEQGLHVGVGGWREGGRKEGREGGRDVLAKSSSVTTSRPWALLSSVACGRGEGGREGGRGDQPHGSVKRGREGGREGGRGTYLVEKVLPLEATDGRAEFGPGLEDGVAVSH